MPIQLTESMLKKIVDKAQYYKTQCEKKDIIIKALNDQIEESNNFIDSLNEKED
jgi:hypothetical protein